MPRGNWRPNLSIRSRKKPRTMPGLKFAGERGKSVTGDERTAPVEVVVHAGRDKIHTAANPISSKERASSRNKKRRVAVVREDMIVLNGNRPIRGKAVFEADANCAAPLRVITGRCYNRVRCG